MREYDKSAAVQVAEVSAAAGVILWDEVVLPGATPGTYLSEAFLITFDSTANLDPEFFAGAYSLYWLKPSGGLVSSKTPTTELDEAGTYVVITPDWANVTTFVCDFDPVSRLQLTPATALTWLNCNTNQLTTLDVSSNVALTTLYCYSNSLTALDVSANVALTDLNCSYNSLDVDAVDAVLAALFGHENSTGSVNISGNTLPSASGWTHALWLAGEKGWAVVIDSGRIMVSGGVGAVNGAYTSAGGTFDGPGSQTIRWNDVTNKYELYDGSSLTYHSDTLLNDASATFWKNAAEENTDIVTAMMV